jgi:hypothetical protein
MNKKSILSLICLMLIGCAPGAPFHVAAYYQPGKTIKQANEDCEECKRIGGKYNSIIAFRNCMEDKGYKIYPTGQLREMRDEGKVVIQEDFWTSKDIAGDVIK